MYDTFDAEITVYNKVRGTDTTSDVWVRTTFTKDYTGYTGVSWHGKTKVNIGDAGLIGADVFRIRIRDSVMQEYINPKEWNGQGWTMQAGDYIRKGISTEPDPAIFDTDVTLVMAVRDNRRGVAGMQHLAIEGK